MTISELADRAGVKVSTVRYYERRGLLPTPDRSPGGYRLYDEEDVRRVRFLRRGQGLGFTLAELATFVAVSDRARTGTVTAGEVAEIGAAKLDEIDHRIADLHRMRDALDDLLSAPGFDPHAPCPVVAALASEPTSSSARHDARSPTTSA